MSEHIQNFLTMFNERAPIGRLFGMKLSFNEENNALIELPYNPDLDHALGAIHGGVYVTMMDTAGWFTSAVRRESGCMLVTSEMSVHFIKPVQKNTLRAEARIIRQGKRQDIVEMSLYNEKNSLVGHAVGTFMVVEQ